MMHWSKQLSVGKKLVFVEGFAVLLVLGALTWFATSYTTTLGEERLRAELQARVDLISDMVTVYNGSLEKAAGDLSAVFIASFPGEITAPPGRTVTVAGVETPALLLGEKVLNLDFSAVDRFHEVTGSVATIFARRGDDFVRIATSLKKEDGSRAIGTFLGPAHPGYAKLMAGQEYVGKAVLFSRDYLTKYVPVRDRGGRVIGALFIGLDFTDGMRALEEKIRSLRFGRTGYLSVIDARSGDARGSLIVHPSRQGQNVLAARDSAGREYVKQMLESRRGIVEFAGEDAAGTGGDRLAAYFTYPGWEWLIVASFGKEELLAGSRALAGYLVVGGLVAIALLLGLLLLITRRLVSGPLGVSLDLAQAVAGGDLTREIRVESRDEAGRVLEALRGMVEKLTSVVASVKGTAANVAAGSQELSSSAEEMSQGASEQAGSVEEVSASMEQMVSNIQQNADNAQQTEQHRAQGRRGRPGGRPAPWPGRSRR